MKYPEGRTEIDNLEWKIDQDGDVEILVWFEDSYCLTKKDLETMLKCVEDLK